MEYLVRWSWESEVRFHGACRLDRARTFAFAQAIYTWHMTYDEPAAPSSLNFVRSAFTDWPTWTEGQAQSRSWWPLLPSTGRKELVGSKGLIGVHPIPIVPFTLIENIAWYLWWTGRCCRYPLVSRGMLVLETVSTSPLSGEVPTQHSLILCAGPYCGLTVHNQRSSSRTSAVVSHVTDLRAGLSIHHCCDRLIRMRRVTRAYSGQWVGALALRWMLCILSRESFKQPVQPFKGTWCITRKLSSGCTKKGDRSCRYLAIFTGSSNLPHLMKAVGHIATNNAVDSS